MPARPHRQCTYPGCTNLVQTKAPRCEKHPEKPWVKTGLQTKRITGDTLIALRKQLFRKQPLCVSCLAMVPERITLATQRDHVIPLAEGGTEDDDNVQPLCQECHDIKSKAERERGLRRKL